MYSLRLQPERRHVFRDKDGHITAVKKYYRCNAVYAYMSPEWHILVTKTKIRITS